MTTTNLKCAIAVFALLVVSFAGCGGDQFKLAPVSGKVTIDGKPAAGVAITFSPVPNGGTSIVGPFSAAMTDADGKFTLKAKGGSEGAVIGPHTVSCQYADYDAEEAAELTQTIQEKQAYGEDVSDLIAKRKSLKNRKPIPEKFQSIELDVPPSGLTDYEFTLTSK